MNQTQKNLLVNLVKKRAAEIRAKFKDAFPSIRVRNNQKVEVTTYYDFRFRGSNPDILPADLGNSLSHIGELEQLIEQTEEAKELAIEEFNNRLEQQSSKVIDALNRANDKLSKSVDEIEVQIQFAKDAGSAQKLLDSLPDIQDLVEGI